MTIGCSQVSFAYSQFPSGSVTTNETVSIDNTQVVSKQFTFSGGSATDVVPVSVPSGTHTVTAHADWTVDGGGHVDVTQTVTCGAPPSPCPPSSIASNFNGTTGRETVDELLRNADMAMYNAKASGKHCYAVYEPEMHARIRRRRELTTALDGAVERREIAVYYQPIVALSSGSTVGLEALVRWQRPGHGLVAPGAFVPLAEETGRMVPIGRAVLREACRRAAAWQAAPNVQAGIAISVNLSLSELQRPSLAREVAAIVDETGLPPQSLILEITETAAMRDPGATVKTLHELHELGVRLALDDFGTGYSSLSHLRDFPLDLLKIAKPFVDRLNGDRRDTTFVEAILRLADVLELEVVAEGIEEQKQAHVLRALDCRLGQGYHFSRPLDAPGTEEHLAEAQAQADVARLELVTDRFAEGPGSLSAIA